MGRFRIGGESCRLTLKLLKRFFSETQSCQQGFADITTRSFLFMSNVFNEIFLKFTSYEY